MSRFFSRDGVCVYLVLLLFAPRFLSANVTVVRVLIDEADYVDGSRLPSHWYVAGQGVNSSLVVSLRCPPEYFSDGGRCVPCQQCISPLHESRRCGPYLDRNCGAGVRLDVWVEGVGWLDMGLLPSVTTGFVSYISGSLNVSDRRECTWERTFDGFDCVPCAKCLPHELEARGCGTWHDRVCLGHSLVQVVVDGAVNLTSIDVELLRQRLIERMRYNFSAFNYSVNATYNHSLVVRAKTCPAGSYMNKSAWSCAQCTVCRQGWFYLSNCSLDADAKCKQCTACTARETLAWPCTRFADAQCSGGVQLELALDGASQLDAALLAWLFQRLSARNFSVYENDTATLFQCGAGQFLSGSLCANCSSCAPGTYLEEPCRPATDAVCAACAECKTGEYEGCPCAVTGACPSGRRVCYAYSAQNLTLFIAWGGPVGVSLYAGLLREFNARGYEVLSYSPRNATVRLVGVLYRIPPGMTDFSQHVLRAASNRSSGRRLLQAGCPADYYPFDFAEPVGRQCIPCQCAPNLAVDALTPPLLYYFLDDALCPPQQVWTCDGVNRFCASSGLAAPVEVDEVALSQQSCPPGQAQELDAGFPVCVGVPCGPGFEGEPGFCTPCAAGHVKSGVGFGPCQACEPGSFQSNATCAPCPGLSTSLSGSTECYCGPGLIGAPPCAACPPGSFEGPLGACEVCPAGAFSSSNASASCRPCAPGRYAALPGATSCVDCSPGTTQSLHGSSSCAPCAPGTSSAGIGSDLEACPPCAEGRHAPVFGASSCLDCAPGYASRGGASSCDACLPGTFSLGGSGACHFCAKNSYSGQAQGFCVGCPEGTYAGVASTQCYECASEGDGAVLGGCEPCPVGTRASAGVCAPCEAGKFSVLPGSVVCYRCAPGRHSFHGQSECFPCPFNTFGEGCAACPWGAVTYAEASTACEACPAGTYAGRGFCKNCPANTFSSNFTCPGCPQDTVAPPGAARLSECMAREGYYALPGSRATVCPADHYCIQGSMRPAPCAEGSRADAGSGECYEPVQRQWWLTWIVAPVWVTTCCVCAIGMGRRRRNWIVTKTKPKIQVNIIK